MRESESPVLAAISSADRPVVEALWQLYRHDMSEFTDSHPGADGLFNWGRLPGYFENNSEGWLIRSGAGQLAGFAFVTCSGDGSHSIGDFFIMRRWRRRGFAMHVDLALLSAHPGPWEIAFQSANSGAGALWRAVAEHVAPAEWHEETRPVPGKPHVPADVWLTFSVK